MKACLEKAPSADELTESSSNWKGEFDTNSYVGLHSTYYAYTFNNTFYIAYL